MSHVRVTPWQDGDPVPEELLSAIQARRPNGELIGIDRVLMKSVPLATGWNGLLGRVRSEFKLDLQYLELIMLRVAQAQIESVSTDGDGMNIDELEALVKQKAVKAVYLVPTFGNPSGVTLTPARRAQLVALSKQYDFLIIEDEPYSEINFSDTRYKPLLAHAQEQGEGDNIIYTSTFSKILAPGTRVGWVIVPAWLKRAVVTLKQATDLHTSALSQALTEQYLQTGRLPAQIDRIRKAYKQKCDTLSHALNQELGEYLTFHQPKGGMFLWATFKDGRNTTEWLKNTLANGVVFVPGEFFYSDHPDHSTLRMSYVTPSEENLKEAVRRLKISLT
ncbi:aminotransferase-like domain-containing protein [Cronobacter turicensis]|uniref:aminotransferase-like domain-containing protein n=1 Tax=Cronobacter turicensis TaxID=413502 RepID=UPI000CFB694A|nr:PLP-dependent aminotransferase family protein [Cronobacter turicensis]